MDQPVHGRHAAIYAVPAKRLPKSFFVAAGVAALIHAGLAWYLIHQTFAIPKTETPSEGPIITIDTFKPQKPVTPDKPKPTKAVPPIHDPVITTHVIDTIPIAPQKNGVETVTPPDNLPIVETPKPTPDTGTTSSATEVHWARFPDADALASYYPPRAAEDEIEGSATVQCTVLNTAGQVSCVAVAESPGRYGFGIATVRMVQDKGRIDVTKGNATVGSILRQTVTWRLN